MADFENAYPKLLDLEGRVWTNDAADNGGETYCGISRVYWPNEPLWTRVDMAKPGLKRSEEKKLTERLANDAEIGTLVARFYCDWWYRIRLNELRSQRTAFFLFQAAVNVGNEKAVRWAQTAAHANGYDPGIDGVMGSRTIQAIDALEEDQYLRDLAVFQRYFYLMRIIESPGQIVNKAGWERRVSKAIGE